LAWAALVGKHFRFPKGAEALLKDGVLEAVGVEEHCSVNEAV
jgi:hypothetical protein